MLRTLNKMYFPLQLFSFDKPNVSKCGNQDVGFAWRRPVEKICLFARIEIAFGRLGDKTSKIDRKSNGKFLTYMQLLRANLRRKYALYKRRRFLCAKYMYRSHFMRLVAQGSNAFFLITAYEHHSRIPCIKIRNAIKSKELKS